MASVSSRRGLLVRQGRQRWQCPWQAGWSARSIAGQVARPRQGGNSTCVLDEENRAYLLDLVDLQQRAKGKGGEIENAVKIAATVQKGSVTIRDMNGHRSAEKQRLRIKHEEKIHQAPLLSFGAVFVDG